MNTIKTYSQFVNEALLVKVPSFEEAKQDMNTVRDAMDKKTKVAIADKYGIKSAKAGEIIAGIWNLLNTVHKSKSPNEYTDEDFQIWWSCFDGPTSSVALKKALDGEKIEWCEFVLNKAHELVFNGKRGDYWMRAQRSFEKYINSLLNKDKNSKDVNLQNLIATLMEKTKEFHDNYIENVKLWSKRKYESLLQMKDFKIEDYMSIFGTIDRETLIRAGKGDRSVNYIIDRSDFWRHFHPYSEEYTAKKDVVIFGATYEAKTIRKPVTKGSYSMRDLALATGEEFADIPSKNALRRQAEVLMFNAKYKWNLKDYTEDNVKTAEDKFKSDIMAIAEKVRRMNMEEALLELLSIESDPKHYDITLTDGKKTVHARSIFAAEFSEKVTPHYRFIIT